MQNKKINYPTDSQVVPHMLSLEGVYIHLIKEVSYYTQWNVYIFMYISLLSTRFYSVCRTNITGCHLYKSGGGKI